MSAYARDRQYLGQDGHEESVWTPDMYTPDVYYVISSTDLDKDCVRVMWSDGTQSQYHFFWLRDNCECAACGPHSSGSRFQRLLDIPPDVAPTEVVAGGVTLSVVWSGDAHRSTYAAGWLREHDYSNGSCGHPPVSKKFWDATLDPLPSIDYRAAIEVEAEMLKLLSFVSVYGFVRVTGMGTAPDELEHFATRLGYIRETHYGRFFDLQVSPDPQLLGHFPDAILPHTDETYRQVPTGINFFHCLVPSSDGGGVSILVDSHGLAEKLHQLHPESFELLTRVPVRHERRIHGQVIRSDNPAFTLDTGGRLIEVRLNERTISGLCVPFDLMMDTYRALRQAFSIAYDPDNWVRTWLDAGEALVFDNLRVLHGRTRFTADRHLRQTQVMRDEFYAKLNALQERAGE